MKTRHHLAAAFCIAATLTAGIGLASCTEDARTPGADADPTTQPLIFTASMAASADAPATRSNTARGVWTEGDWVAVEANDVVKKYLVHLDNGTATLRPADADNTHFWPAANQSVSVRAWRYGNDQHCRWDDKPYWWNVETHQDGTASNGESLYQRSDFLYAPEKSVSYSPETGAGLTFYHQTARIVVRIREAGVVTADNKGKINVRIGVNKNNYQLLMEGTFAAGRIDPATGQYSGLTADPNRSPNYVAPKPIPEPGTGYACSYEGLIIPQDMSNKPLIEVTLNGKNYHYTPTDANLQGGYTYTYDITVSENGKLEVTASEPIPDWVDSEEGGSGMAHEVVISFDDMTTISDNRTYLLTGKNEDVPGGLVHIFSGNPTIILRDVDIKGRLPIQVSSGTAILKVEGNNRIIGDGAEGIRVYKPATVRIIGDGRDKNRLTVKAEGEGVCAIGKESECGNIDISGITLVAEGSGAPAIGAGPDLDGNNTRICGSITITDSHVEATGGPGAAAIGFGYYELGDVNSTHEMGDITITNSTLKCTVQQGPNGIWPAHIGGSANGTGQYTVGKISITPPEGTKGEEFFRDFNRNGGNADVIVGFPHTARPSNSVLFDVYWRHSAQGAWIDWGFVPKLQ